MKRVLLGLLGIVFACSLAGIVSSRPGAGAHIYTVAQLRAALARDPQAWSGRTILVRGTAVGLLPSSCLPAVWCSVGLIEAGASDRASFAPLVPMRADPLVAFMRAIPLVGHLVIPPQQLHWGMPAIYRLQMRAVPSCAGSNCYAFMLEDAAPLAVSQVRIVIVPAHLR